MRTRGCAAADGCVGWAASLVMPASIIAHLPKVLFSPALDSLSERMRGAVTLARLRLWRCADGMLRLVEIRA